MEVLHDDNAEQAALLVQHDDACPGLLGARAHRLRPAGSMPLLLVHRHGEPPQGCGNMVRMEVTDAAVNGIMATTFRVPVKRLILVKGSDYQDELDEIRYRIRELDPDLMSDEQYDAELRRLRAGRDRLKALPAEPDRWEEQLTGELYCDIYQALPVSGRGAWLTSHGFVIHATKKEVSVIQGDVRGTAHLG